MAYSIMDELVIARGGTTATPNGQVRVGLPSISTSSAHVTVSTANDECWGIPSIGQSVVLTSGDKWYRVFLLETIGVGGPQPTAKVEITQGVGVRPSAGSTCFS